jgi:hypothetical protein
MTNKQNKVNRKNQPLQVKKPQLKETENTEHQLGKTETAESNGKENNKIENIKLYRLLMVPGIFATLSAYISFFGYTFLKGKLNVAGFSANYVELSVYETIFNAVLGFLHLLKVVGNAVSVGDDATDVIIVVAIVAVGVLIIRNTAVIRLKLFNEIALIFSFAFGMALFLLILLLGYISGIHYMEERIDEGFCKPIVKEYFTNQKIIRGCTKIELNDGGSLSGLTLYEDTNYRFFITNSGSYQINPNQEVVSFNCFHDQSVLDGVNSKVTKPKYCEI